MQKNKKVESILFNIIHGPQELKSGIQIDVELNQKDSIFTDTYLSRALYTTHYPGTFVSLSFSNSYVIHNWRKFNIILLFADSKNTLFC